MKNNQSCSHRGIPGSNGQYLRRHGRVTRNPPRRLGIAVKVREGGLFIYIEEKGEKMREFDDFMDLTDQNKILQCRYHGLNKNLHLEGRILSETDSGLSVGVSLC